ncbi:tyrosine-protein phosphatase [Comamonas composti]|uniref:tyrosine-protein phosphatase n=1 Tax=Comamonas composti TaxID=408558 RepID=UPI00047EE2E4|nr:tyrosine-protein phosphatase [Comamonas composti]
MTPSPTTLSRSIALEGASNFRDLGGYQGLDGRSVRWRQLFRSDHLAKLSQQDLQTLGGMGVVSSADFRGVQESAQLAYAWPGLERHALVVEPSVVQRSQAILQAGRQLTEADTVGLMQDTYRSFVVEYAPRFAQLFQMLLAGQGPLVFHCTAGKDRTGWAAALLLTALGVDEQTVMQDYLLTNALYRRPDAGLWDADPAVLDVLWRVQESYLAAATELVHKEFGGMQAYLSQAMGLDAAARQRLAELYLEG